MTTRKRPDMPLVDRMEGRGDAAWAGAEEGMARAADHAERVEPGWNDSAVDYVRKYAFAHPDHRFMAEDVREYAEARSFSPPPDGRAWGSVMTKAKRAGIIIRDGFGSTTRGPAHTHPRNCWRLRRN